jgi:hypothetical protein
MGEWAIPETITVGAVLFAVILLISKFIGQRTDPQLVALMSEMNKQSAKRDTNRDVNEKQQTEVLKIIEATVSTFADTIREFMASSQQDHTEQLSAIDNIPSAIIPVIDTLKAEIQGQRSEVKIVNDTVTNQDEAIKQVLESLRRVEQSLTVIADGVNVLSADLNTQKGEILTIKSDVAKLGIIPKGNTVIEKPEGEEKHNAESNE